MRKTKSLADFGCANNTLSFDDYYEIRDNILIVLMKKFTDIYGIVEEGKEKGYMEEHIWDVLRCMERNDEIEKDVNGYYNITEFVETTKRHQFTGKTADSAEESGNFKLQEEGVLLKDT